MAEAGAGAGAGAPLAAGENAERALRFLQEEGEGGKKMSCRWFIDRAFYCVTPTNQVTHYYRHGLADECKGTWANMFHCFRANLMEEEKRQDYLKNTALDPSKGPYTSGVWEEKATPGW